MKKKTEKRLQIGNEFTELVSKTEKKKAKRDCVKRRIEEKEMTQVTILIDGYQKTICLVKKSKVNEMKRQASEYYMTNIGTDKDEAKQYAKENWKQFYEAHVNKLRVQGDILAQRNVFKSEEID